MFFKFLSIYFFHLLFFCYINLFFYLYFGRFLFLRLRFLWWIYFLYFFWLFLLFYWGRLFGFLFLLFVINYFWLRYNLSFWLLLNHLFYLLLIESRNILERRRISWTLVNELLNRRRGRTNILKAFIINSTSLNLLFRLFIFILRVLGKILRWNSLLNWYNFIPLTIHRFSLQSIINFFLFLLYYLNFLI